MYTVFIVTAGVERPAQRYQHKQSALDVAAKLRELGRDVVVRTSGGTEVTP